MPITKTERRFAGELRADSQGDELSLVGYASVFNSQSEDLGGFRETVLPGAFARSLREGSDVKCLMNHDPSLVLGRTKNNTLTLNEDGRGLAFRCILPPTSTARDLYSLVKRGDIDSCSFAFIPKEQSWEDLRSENGDLYSSRKLHDVDLLDVSAVTNPAYPSTSLMARSLFPDGAPIEVRSALAAMAKRGAEAQPPMPYAISLPQPFDSDMKQEWWDAFMVGYIEAVHVLRMKGQEAIAAGITAANLAIQPDTETDAEIAGQGKNPSAIKNDVVDTDANRAAALEEEVRKKKVVDDAAAAEENARGKKNADDVSNPDSDNYDPDSPDYDPTMDYSDDEYSGDDASERIKKAKAKDAPIDGGADGGADGGEAGASEVSSRTKTVGDKILHACDYAWVGDANDPSTWKLPIDEAGRTQSALVRFSQTKGIPDEKREEVWKTIIGACKNFEVKVVEDDSKRVGISHEVASAILNKEAFDKLAESVVASDRLRVIQLEIELQ